MTRLERCADCICLVEEDGEWFCDEYDEMCDEIEECGEWGFDISDAQLLDVFYKWPDSEFWMAGTIVLTDTDIFDYNTICSNLGISDDEVLIYTDSSDPEYIKENFDGLDVIIVQEARL